MRKDQFLKTMYMVEEPTQFGNGLETFVWITDISTENIAEQYSTALREM